MKYQPYPEYKDSGIEWLGQIPAHWEVRRLKFAAPQVNAKLSAKPSEKIYLGLENIESGTGQILFDSLSDNVESIVATFQPGDILFGKLRPYLAKVIHADFDGVCTTELLVLRPIRQIVEGRFLFYMLLSHNFINIINSMTYGVKMPRANATQIGNLPASFPPLPEQRAIAAFLDRETAHIDALIARKRELIDLLHRQRTAVISHAATKGLDPAAPLKDSGIEWLGQIPAHWEVRRLKFMSKIYNGATPKSTEVTYWGGDINWVTPDDLGSLTGKFITETKRKITYAGYASCGATLVRPGSIVISTRAPIGHLAIAATDVCTNQGCRSLVPNGQIDSLFLYFALNSSKAVLQSLGSGSTFQELSARELGSFAIPFPPIPEQHAIAAFLDRETARIDRLIREIEESIALLQRQRTALISAAVTGKIDVREQK